MIEKMGGRKILFGIMLAALGVAVDVLAKNGLSSNLLQLFIFLGVGFFGGNGIEHLSGALKKPGSSAGVGSAQEQEVGMALNNITNEIQQANENINSVISQNQITQQALTHVIGKA